MTDIGRREAIQLAVLGTIAAACGVATSSSSSSNSLEDAEPSEQSESALGQDAATPQTDGAPSDVDAAQQQDGGVTADADADVVPPLVIVYDTYAQALYFDGTYGPTTGTIKATDMGAGVNKTYDFWHGHNGMLHRFTLTAANFADLRKKKRVTVMTTTVDNHQHTLFVDPVDLRWRVPGAQPTKVPL